MECVTGGMRPSLPCIEFLFMRVPFFFFLSVVKLHTPRGLLRFENLVIPRRDARNELMAQILEHFGHFGIKKWRSSKVKVTLKDTHLLFCSLINI